MSGNSANGSKAVTATGIASVAHHMAIKITIAATIQPSSLSSDGDGDSSVVKKRNIPSQKPFFLKA
jgi:hypothetical protein